MKTQPKSSLDLHSADPGIISSLLQKSIRRGEVAVAQSAARRLLHQRGVAFWRRLLMIAFEDVGVGSPDLLIEVVSIASDPRSPAGLGGNEASALRLAGLLANAPKDRSADYLICAAKFHPRLQSIRKALRRAPLSDCLTVAEDAEWPIPERAVAAWYASGMSWGEERGEYGVLETLLEGYRQQGTPNDLVEAVATAAARTREPITVLVPLLWLEARASGFPRSIQAAVPPTRVEAGLPLYALDKHTRLGRAAITKFASENKAVRQFLKGHIDVARRRDAVLTAAFQVDATPVGKRLDWPASRGLEVFGRETDLLRAGVPLHAQEGLCKLVSDNLDHLNDVRAAVLAGSRSDLRHGDGHVDEDRLT